MGGNMRKKMVILIIIALAIGISSTSYSEEGDWIQSGDGSSYEEALKNAKWNIITKAMEKAIGAREVSVAGAWGKIRFARPFDKLRINHLAKLKLALYLRIRKLLRWALCSGDEVLDFPSDYFHDCLISLRPLVLKDRDLTYWDAVLLSPSQ